MKDKEKIFELLREAVETPDEKRYVEELICKVEKIMPPIEVIDDRRLKFDGVIYLEDKSNGHYEKHVYLHRAIWKFFHGDIPEGYEVHHGDLNPKNNDITNLQLMTKDEHRQLHADASMRVFTCVVCGKEFKAKTIPQNARYCSVNCRNKARRDKYIRRRPIRRLEIRTCPVCGREFKTYSSQNAKYCSYSCAGKARTNASTETRKCLICGQEFTTRKSRNKRYCSRSCVMKARHKKH